MKKILLSFGTVALAAIPVLTIISCGHSVTAATAQETQKEISTPATIMAIQKELNNLTPAELATPTKIIAVLKKVIPGEKYQKVIEGITTVKFIKAVTGQKASLVITLMAATATTAAIEVTILNLAPQITTAELDTLLIVPTTHNSLMTEYAKLTSTDLAINHKVVAIIQKMFPDSIYATSIARIKSNWDLGTKTLKIILSPTYTITFNKLEPTLVSKTLQQLRDRISETKYHEQIIKSLNTLNSTELSQGGKTVRDLISVGINDPSFDDQVAKITTAWKVADKTLTVSFTTPPGVTIEPLAIKVEQYQETFANVKSFVTTNADGIVSRIKTNLEKLKKSELTSGDRVIHQLKLAFNNSRYTKEIELMSAALTGSSGAYVLTISSSSNVLITIQNYNFIKIAQELRDEMGVKAAAILTQLNLLTSDQLNHTNNIISAIITAFGTDVSYRNEINLILSSWGSDTHKLLISFKGGVAALTIDVTDYVKNGKELHNLMQVTVTAASIKTALLTQTSQQLGDNNAIKGLIKGIITDPTYLHEINLITSSWNSSSSSLTITFADGSSSSGPLILQISDLSKYLKSFSELSNMINTSTAIKTGLETITLDKYTAKSLSDIKTKLHSVVDSTYGTAIDSIASMTWTPGDPASTGTLTLTSSQGGTVTIALTPAATTP